MNIFIQDYFLNLFILNNIETENMVRHWFPWSPNISWMNINSSLKIIVVSGINECTVINNELL